MRDLLPYLKPYWKVAVLAPLFMLLEVFMDVLQPRYMANIVNQGVLKLDLHQITVTGVTMVVITFIGLLAGVGCNVFASIASQNFGADIRDALFEKVQTFSFRNLDKFQTGTLITRMTNDVTQVQTFVQMSQQMMVRAPGLVVGSIVMALTLSLHLGLILLVSVPILALFLIFLIRISYPLFFSVQSRLDNVNTVVQENLAGIRAVKAFVRSRFEIDRFSLANNAYTAMAIKAARVMVLNVPVMNLIMNLSVVAVLWYGSHAVWNGSMPLGNLIAFINYVTQILSSLMMVGMILMNVSQARVSADRIREVLKTDPDIANKPGVTLEPSSAPGVANKPGITLKPSSVPGVASRPYTTRDPNVTRSPDAAGSSPVGPVPPDAAGLDAAGPDAGDPNVTRTPAAGPADAGPDTAGPAAVGPNFARGRVEFDAVSFSYGDNTEHKLVLRDVSFVAEAGQKVAIIGSTGSGKSSLVNLIPRLYDATRGTVRVDGVDVRDMNLGSLRRQIGMVLQESILFSGTIHENIAFGRPDASDGEIEEAAKVAQAHGFISSLQDGYDTLIGQRGVNLSGGQKQRIAIARALLVTPSILILDDSTSALDLATESKLQSALRHLMRHATTILIAQRISSVIDFEKIIVLEDGRVVGEGSHSHLMESCAVYQDIYESQLGQRKSEMDEEVV